MALNSNNTDGNGEFVRGDSKPCVLVVDDNEMVAHALAKLLGAEGWRVAISYSGLDALKQVECETLAAAVIDIHLPDISGLVLSSKLRQQYGPKLPIIVLSGDTSMENIRSLEHVGATYFISKPFNSEHLVERLREFSAV
jgi:two-component system sensor histidine kinase RpfC